MNKDNLRELFAEYERQASIEAKTAASVRKQAKGILKPELISKIVAKNEKLPENKRQGIVLAYGMLGQVEYSPDDLKRFLNALEEFQKQPYLGENSVHGVPYAKLFYASRAVDIERSQEVPSSTLYQRRGNIFFFRVIGNSRPYYRVQIRLEEWDAHIATATPALVAVNSIVQGRISFECPCGRHQYWYRYMATLGNYAIEPLETGFPKIRNRGLFGCCCKHVLKVLKDLDSNRVKFILCKELERERNKSGFSSSRKGRIFSNQDLRLAQAKRMTQNAMTVFAQYKKEADELKKKLTPRNGKKIKVNRMILNGLKTILLVARSNPALEKPMLDGFAKTHNLTREDVDKIIMEHNL